VKSVPPQLQPTLATAADMAVAEVGQDSSEHVNELEEHVAVHVDPTELTTHLAPDENMYRKSATDATFQLAMFWLNAGAELNMLSSVVAEATFQPPMSRLNLLPANTYEKLVSWATFHPPISWLNAFAE
jgi:hypothetical protein